MCAADMAFGYAENICMWCECKKKQKVKNIKRCERARNLCRRSSASYAAD